VFTSEDEALRRFRHYARTIVNARRAAPKEAA
jgi:hypothetical protein